ncbi:DUF7093 family protein [Halorussus litoreus]|uniref:DUF7093 family protein n=1 Tax=Halorussus litoreus TaxID=1710536 RepID=UPI000E24ECA0|nr:hypothetical protein [Halorussus litoreus]
MSLRCSLLGHSYGEAEIEREREEQGSEVVVTVREFEECERCGDQNVLSENKEVTALESPAPDLESAETDPDVGTVPDADTASDANAGGATGATGSADTGVSGSTDPDVTVEDDGAEIMTDSSDGAGSSGSAEVSETTATQASADSGAEGATGSTDSGSAGGASAGGASASGASDSGASADGVSLEDGDGERDGDAPSAADDDGVILDDESDGSDGDDRQPGEWPDAETTHLADAEEGGHADWPEVGQEDEGYDAEPGGASTDVEFGGGLTPESASAVDESEAEEVEFVNSEGDALRSQDAGGGSPELSSGISAGAEAPSLSGPADDPDVDAEFVCPECDYREAVSGSSLRAGDICPECARGYLATE